MIFSKSASITWITLNPPVPSLTVGSIEVLSLLEKRISTLMSSVFVNIFIAVEPSANSLSSSNSVFA